MSFLRMQHEAQQRSYRQRYPNLRYRIMLAGDQQAGRVATVATDTAVILVDLIVLPDFQNRGIGSTFLRTLQAEAGKKRLPVILTVLQDNRVRRLYERFGFQAVGGRYSAYLAAVDAVTENHRITFHTSAACQPFETTDEIVTYNLTIWEYSLSCSSLDIMIDRWSQSNWKRLHRVIGKRLS